MSENPYFSAIKQRGSRLAFLREDRNRFIYLKEHYKYHPAEFINDWMITYNPQVTPSYLPFLLFPKQKELILFFHERNLKREEAICEKCREVGFTWLAISYAIWFWIFYPEKKISFGSRKEALVDTLGDPDSIFEKMRLSLRYLPHEFRPIGFDINSHMLFMKIINPENNSIITGEAGDNIGRGGRSTIYFLDEAAFLERPMKVEAALSGNTDCKIYISTPNGVGNVFHKKRIGGKVPVFTFNWFDDPRKNKEWYDKKKETLDSVIFAQEVLIDYGASLEDVCIPAEWVKAAVNFNIENIETGKRVGGLDVADEGSDANAIVLRKGSKVFYTKSWKEGNTTQTSRKAYNIYCENNLELLCYDNIGVGAGAKGEFSTIQDPSFKVLGINVGMSPTRGEYVLSKKNEDMFLNLKSQIWWSLRRRFEKTFEHVSNVKKYSPDELISIPDDNELIIELSAPRFFFSENGKIKIESKDMMRRRGVKSPNKADALMLAFSPVSLLQTEPNIRMI